jgi:N-acylneuraminate cytidylyltransferase/CMP-N,N'-diacetyllegionaminic acid synthase
MGMERIALDLRFKDNCGLDLIAIALTPARDGSKGVIRNNYITRGTMIDKKITVLGIIPARGGSKSVPNKNIAMLASKPLIAYTIQAALDAKNIDRTIVSTDSQKIGDTALTYGAELPFLRPSELAQDDTPGIEPILHAVCWLDENEGYRPDYVMVLQPTSPLRTNQDIESAVQLAQEREADSVVSVCPADQHPYWMKKLTNDARLTDLVYGRSPQRHKDGLKRLYTLSVLDGCGYIS